MRVHLAFMGAERAVSVCYDTMPPDAGRVTAASYVGRCEARWRGPRDHGAPREPPRFEPLTFGLDRKGTKGQRARLGAAGLSFAVRWVDPLDVARFVGAAPPRRLAGRYIPDPSLKRQIPGGAPPPIYG